MNAPAVVPPVAALAAAINDEHVHAQRDATNAIVHAVRCGELLLEVKAGIKHGEWMPWIEQNCDFEQSTADRYMKAARQIATGVGISSLSSLFPSGKIKKTNTPVAQIEDHDHVDADHHGDGDDDVQLPVHGHGEDHGHGDGDAEPEPRRTRRQSRGARWADAAEQAIGAIENLIQIQGEYQEWRDGLPENLAGSAVAEKLDTVIEIDLEGALSTLSEARDADLPLGFGRD